MGDVLIALAVYVALAAALDGPTHRTLYPLIGYGHPLTGRRRWAVRLFGPFILLGIGLCRLPVVLVGIFILIMRA